jgi:hypothetical protein
MVTLHIEHPISDYDTWRAAFDAVAEARRAAGVSAERIGRPVDDERYIVVDLDFASRDQAAGFLDFLESKIWMSSAASPALAGRPRTMIVQPVPAD